MMLAAAEVEFAGQGLQISAPIPTLYVPGEQDEHVLPFAPVYPVLH